MISDAVFRLMITVSFGLMLAGILIDFYTRKIRLWLQSLGSWVVRETPTSYHFPKGWTLYLKFIDMESSSWCCFYSSTLPGFERSCYEADDEILAHSAELECKVTNLAGTQKSRPDLERVKDVNPDPLWGNPFDSQPSNVEPGIDQYHKKHLRCCIPNAGYQIEATSECHCPEKGKRCKIHSSN